ncbi:MAG TPA: helix-turn-helix domain-containing protein [Mucilaginibacter sp.]|jgi:excisionase family DNA binding protein|nr:helix-turn-helix domain-containing protein [Mucilaginibacter sp.]
MDRITFDQLPEMVALLLDKVTKIEQMLTGREIPEQRPEKEMLTVSEAAEFMNVSKSTLYKMSFNRDVPVYKPTGRRVYFKREDLVKHITHNRVMSRQEIEQEAINYLAQSRSLKRKALRTHKN